MHSTTLERIEIMKQTLKQQVYIYAYFSQYASPGDMPSFSLSNYELTSNSKYVLIKTVEHEFEFEVPDTVAEYTPARLAAFKEHISRIQLTAAEDIKEIDDEIQKLLCIENSTA